VLDVFGQIANVSTLADSPTVGDDGGLCDDFKMQGFAAPFQISHPSIQGLLSQHTMAIPDLQRYYAWEEDNARELCADLERLLESLRAGRPDPQHFFGTLVVTLHAGERDDIVDGQQRMTTVTLLLGQIRAAMVRLAKDCHEIAKLNKNNQPVFAHHTAVASSAEASANQIQSMLFVNDGFDQSGQLIWNPRIQVTQEITKTYRSLLDGGDGKIASENLEPANNLRKVASVFENRLVEPLFYDNKEPLEKFDHLNELLTVVGSGLIVVRLATTNADSAYELFESLNARGVPLNALDHLKVWMLAVFAQEKADSTNVAIQMRALSNDDREEQIAFFENFYEARSQDNTEYDGINKPKNLVSFSRRNLFHDVTQNGTPDVMKLTDRIEFEVDYMTKLFPVWKKLKQSSGVHPYLPSFFDGTTDAEWTRDRLELLLGAVLKHQKAYPYLMVAAERLQNKPAEFAELIHVLERFFFRYMTICGGKVKSVAGLYNALLVDLEANPGFNMNLVKLKAQALIDLDASDAVFRARLVTKLGYLRPTDRIRTKYFFQMLDEYQYNPKPLKRRGLMKLTEWHLEHIVPQNPRPGDPSLPEDELNSIGNLCLLPPWINNKLSNLNYADKQTEAKRLRGLTGKDQVNINMADPEQIFYFGTGAVWSSQDVAQRITDLQDFACQVFKV
jgi:hypothetical protein